MKHLGIYRRPESTRELQASCDDSSPSNKKGNRKDKPIASPRKVKSSDRGFQAMAKRKSKSECDGMVLPPIDLSVALPEIRFEPLNLEQIRFEALKFEPLNLGAIFLPVSLYDPT
jgi:hypothetical protein